MVPRKKSIREVSSLTRFLLVGFPQLILVNQSGLYEKHGVLLRVRSDGSISMYETVNAVGKIDLDLRRYPIDQQRLEAVFHVLGFDSNEITLRLEPDYNDGDLNIDEIFKLPQWQLTGIKSSIGTRNTPLIGKGATTSTFVVSIDLQRSSFFILRLVILPLIIIVMLSWSVFWMDKTSLGDRISVSFIGILTAVTYQVILSEILPRISYFTLINDGFLGFSFFIMSMTVIVNLRVGYLDRHGMSRSWRSARSPLQVDVSCDLFWGFTGYVLDVFLVVKGECRRYGRPS